MILTELTIRSHKTVKDIRVGFPSIQSIHIFIDKLQELFDCDITFEIISGDKYSDYDSSWR